MLKFGLRFPLSLELMSKIHIPDRWPIRDHQTGLFLKAVPAMRLEPDGTGGFT